LDACHLEPQHLPPTVAQNQERKQAIKSQCRDYSHINSSDRLSVVLKKRLPGLRKAASDRASCILRPSTSANYR
jgi:hypothetical protein